MSLIGSSGGYAKRSRAISFGRSLAAILLACVVIMLPLFSYAETLIESSQRGKAYYWNFDGNSNEVFEGKYNGNDEGVTYVEGKFNKAADFKGDGKIIDMGETEINLGTSYTIAFWFKAGKDNGTYNVFFAKGPKETGHYEVYIDPKAREIYLYSTEVGNIPSGYLVEDSEWHHFALTCQNKELHFYIDGNEISASATAGDPADRKEKFVVGSLVDKTLPYIGALDELYILTWGLDGTEISELMNNKYEVFPENTGSGNEEAKEDEKEEVKNEPSEPVSQESPKTGDADVSIFAAIICLEAIVFSVLLYKKMLQKAE